MNRSTFRRGFKSEAEALALEVRADLSLQPIDPLDPRALADFLAIRVLGLDDLRELVRDEASVRHFLDVAPSDLSALTVYAGPARLIVVNPRHSSRRKASSIAHELAHVLLEHEPSPNALSRGCRTWHNVSEEEADWAAGALLVPRPAALHIARSGTADTPAASRYGVSVELMRWRLNQTGARLQARRESQRVH